jgi:8-oxo-dGTP pyrophosphatase MutT (NUDIX family)
MPERSRRGAAGEQRKIHQAAAVPFRIDPAGDCEVLLIRRRPRGEWGIPKGMIDPGHTAPEAAAIEAFEEAGVEGTLLPKTLGAFEYPKFGGICHVDVFGLRVTRVHDHYDEELLRERRWFPLFEAVRLVRRPGVAELIARIDAAS